ncbi:MAG TPA: DUF4255 domain-containing protein [Eudoraea sp.]|nr:DUF4255 domain-containing protein [Eudoraea sp.]
MIYTALAHIRDLVNQHFMNEFSAREKAVLSNIVNADGSIPGELQDKIVFFLVSLEEEATLKNNLNRSSNSKADTFAKKPPAIHFRLQLLFCANFMGDNYDEGLAYLSSLIRFFQINRVVQVPNRSGKDPNNTLSSKQQATSTAAQRLSFELCKLDYSELSHLWSAIGAKLMPSVLYKVGMVAFDDLPVSGIIPPIKETKGIT